MTFKFLWGKARAFLPELALISLLTLMSSLTTLAIPWIAAQLLGGLLSDSELALGTIAALLAAVLVATSALTVAATVVSNWTGLRILAELRKEAYARVQAMPMAFHDRSNAGDMQALINYEVSNLSGFLTGALANLPSMLMTAAGAVVLLFLLDPTIAAFIPLFVAAGYIISKLIGRRLRILGAQTRAAEARLYTLANSDLGMLPAIKSFAVEDEHRARYDDAVDQSRQLAFRQSRITAFFSPAVALLAAVGVIAIILASGEQLQTGERTPTELFAFLLYAALLTRPMGSLANIYGQYQRTKGSLARLEDVFGQSLEPGHEAGLPSIERARGAITFENVSFAYPKRGIVFEGVSFEIEPGETVALTGDNGIGKSTLIRLLLRFYETGQGAISLDGKAIASVNVRSLRSQFGYVPQRPLLFDGTVKDNIAFGDPNPDEGEIARAATIAQAAEFIADLPNGLETKIGDNGVRLSGGQRQRIALARAIYRDPPVYILDEATSMYDLEGEASFVEACASALRSATVIIITHRPASLALANRVLKVSKTAVKPIEI